MAKKAGAPIGNTNAAKAKIWSDAIRMELIPGDSLRKCARALIQAAMNGDIQALTELGDRIEGKTLQSTELSGPEESRLIIQWADSTCTSCH